LWAELKADTGAFQREMRDADRIADELTKSVETAERSVVEFGQSSTSTSRQFEKLSAVLSDNKRKLTDAGAAFERGEISAKQMASVFNQVSRSSQNAAGKISDLKSKINDLNAAQKKAANDHFRAHLNQVEKARTGQSFMGAKGPGQGIASQVGNNAFLSGITGGLVGAGVAGAGLAAVGMTANIAGGMASLGAQSVQMAADFQMTQNAMTLFAGSSEKAKAQLKDLAALSRSTPGLGLEDAEKGAVRLRAMGFDADLTKKLLSGLGKQKLLSGVGNEAIDRVTTNLAQLASGGGDLQDIKDLVQNLPTARKEINEAFGGLSQFQAALKANPQAAIRKLADELAGVQAPAGGFNDAMQKMNDSFILIGRAFGEPILDPLTEGVKTLTLNLNASEASWRSWGQSVGDTVGGLNAILSAVNAINGASGGWLGSIAGAAGEQSLRQMFPRFSAGIDFVQQINTGSKLLGGSPGAPGMGGSVDFAALNDDARNKSAQALQMQVLEQQIKDKEARENAFRQARGQFLDQSESAVTAKLNAAYKVREAQLRNHLNATQASEVQSIQQLAAVRNQQIADELTNQKIFLAERMKIAKPEEMAGLQMQMATAEATANAEMQANALQAQTQIREAIKKTKTEIASLFVGAQGADNPFVAIFDQGRLAIERVTEATKGLNPNLREMLVTMTQAGMATQAFGQGLQNRLQASDLRDEARQFLAGRADADTPRNFKAALDRRLSAIGAFNQLGLSDDNRSILNDQIIALTQGIDPARLSGTQRSLAANARLSKAAALDAQEKEAKKIQAELVDVLKQLNGNKALQIDIRDPANRTTIGGTSQNVDARYPNR
jgi:hypothetical protein